MSFKGNGQNKSRFTSKTDFLNKVSNTYLSGQNVRKAKFGDKILRTNEIRKKLGEIIREGHNKSRQIEEQLGLGPRKENVNINDRKSIIAAIEKKFGRRDEKPTPHQINLLNRRMRKAGVKPKNYEKSIIQEVGKYESLTGSSMGEITNKFRKMRNRNLALSNFARERDENNTDDKENNLQFVKQNYETRLGYKNPHENAVVSMFDYQKNRGGSSASKSKSQPAGVAGGFGARTPGKSNIVQGNFGGNAKGISTPPIGIIRKVA